jgi:hypothetical protein
LSPSDDPVLEPDLLVICSPSDPWAVFELDLGPVVDSTLDPDLLLGFAVDSLILDFSWEPDMAEPLFEPVLEPI